MNPTLREITAGFSSLEYRIAQTYYEPTLWKTDAPPEVVYEIFKAYKMMQSEGNEEEFLKNVHPSSSMHACMKKPITVKPDFNTENLKDKKKLGKYFVALEANWGPKPRATGGKKASKPEESKAQFQTDEATRVAVLSITACGQGLTLTAAHTVVFAELYWVPGQMIQAEDRVHRIGQQNHVDVHYCIAQGSLDNIIFNSLNRKSQDTTAVLDGKAKHLDAYKETEAGSMDNAKSRRAGADIRNLLSAGSASVATSGSNEHSEKTVGDACDSISNGSASVATQAKKRPSSFAVGENTDVHSADNASSTPTPKKRGRPSNCVQSLAPRSDSQR